MIAVVATYDTRGAAQDVARKNNILRRLGGVLRIGTQKKQHQPVHFWQARLDPHEYRTLRKRAGICIAMKEYPQALAYLGQIAEKMPKYPGIRLDIGSVRSKAGILDRAVDDLTAAIEQCEKIGRHESTPYHNWELTLAKAYKKRGTTHMKLAERENMGGSYEKWQTYVENARKDYEAANRIYESVGGRATSIDFAKSLNKLGELHLLLRDGYSALKCFDRALLICPDFEAARQNRAGIDLRIACCNE